ncbi:MAG: hypothetical protein N2117_06695 [Anaerolineales bacterium]|nr:hypothetical protein [Anaerolineales bacterium]MCX7754920.1 hypothetical protein [Anaerolineales bacterium]MDW8278149.1 hypothetical protein [Anaerolineales bacterium]
MSSFKTSPLFHFLLMLVFIGLVTLFGPQEKSLGANVRYVYIHGAWVLTAQVALILAGVTGFLALLTNRAGFYRWSTALGRSGMVFWVTYLPLSLLAMQTNWNGLFLAEPRFRLALTFAVVGVLLQAGLWLMNRPPYTAAANALFIITLRYVFSNATYIMHPPPSPIFSSGLWNVIAFFVALNGLTLLAAFFLTRWFLSLDKS